MNFTDLQNEWNNDCKIDITNLENELLRTPSLHSKYTAFLNDEVKNLRIAERNFKRLKLELHEFLKNPTKDGMEKGFAKNYCFSSRIKIKSELSYYEDGDELITQKEAEYKVIQDKINYLEKIIWEISRRKDYIGNIIKYRIYLSGV